MQTNQPHPNLDSDMITTTNKTLTSVCGNSLESFEQLWDLAELSPTVAGIFAKLSKTCWVLAGSLNPPELLPNCSRTAPELQKSFASPCKSFASFVQVLKKPSKSSQVLSPFRDPCSQHRFDSSAMPPRRGIELARAAAPASAAMAIPPPRAHRLPSRSRVGSRDLSSSGRDSSLSQDCRSKQLPQQDLNPNGYG